MDFSYSFSDQELAWMQASSVLVAMIALLISALAIYFTAKTYWQKKGAFVRGHYTTSSSVTTKHKYVSNILLENLKDRSIIIFGFYLRMSRNIYIEIETFEEEPLILKPFEVLARSYDPIDSYSFNMKRFNLNHLFDDTYRGVRLVLATSAGKLVIKKPVPIWNPIYEWFKNHSIITMQTNRFTFAGKAYGGNILFIVQLYKDDKVCQTFPLYPQEHTYKWFKDLGGSEDTLKTVDNVKKLFEKVIKKDGMKADRVFVIDACEAQKKAYEDYDEEKVLDLESSWFFVNVLARISTFLANRKMHKQNEARNRKNKEK